MKNQILILIIFCAFVQLGIGQVVQTKSNDLQYFRPAGKQGLNIFETSKQNSEDFEKLTVKVGADFALQFQGLRANNANLGTNVNLPTANLNIDAQLAQGMRVHLRTYLSSRTHEDTWVKGGYLQIDDLGFIKPGFAEKIMNITTIKIGMDDINYGDAHFRRSDNASAIYNPFVGNYIMDGFITEAYMEFTLQPKDYIFVLGISNGNMDQTATITETNDTSIRLYAKAGIDRQVSEDLRVRLTGSYTSAPGMENGRLLYGGDRAGARYYLTQDLRDGRVNPRFADMQAWMINPFVKFRNFEFFGIFEQTSGFQSSNQNRTAGKYTQLAGELLYRFGTKNQFYLGTRYNTVRGYDDYANSQTTPQNGSTNRINAGGGWFFTDNVLAKVEYVNQSYADKGGWDDSSKNFKGFVFEAVISF